MANVLISFDKYYTRLEYNIFLENLTASKVPFKEYVSIKPPYYFYFSIDEAYIPVFLKHDIAPKGTDKYMLERIKAFQQNEIYTLTRKQSDTPNSFEKYVSPIIFRNLKDNDYGCLFRYKNREQLVKITRDLGIKVWDLGKQREWNVAFSYNKFIRNYVPLDWILLEKKKPSDFSKPGEFEYEFNYKRLIKTKLTNKFLNYPYYEDGKYFPLKKTK
jgi:hypothetical protein